MRSDIVPGGIFPDYEPPDHTGKLRKLSELQGDDPLIRTMYFSSTALLSQRILWSCASADGSQAQDVDMLRDLLDQEKSAVEPSRLFPICSRGARDWPPYRPQSFCLDGATRASQHAATLSSDWSLHL